MELERLVEEGEAAEDDEDDGYSSDEGAHDRRRTGSATGKHVTFEDRRGTKGKSRVSPSAPSIASGAVGPSPSYRYRSGHRGDGAEQGMGESGSGEQLFDVGEDEEDELEGAGAGAGRGGRVR